MLKKIIIANWKMNPVSYKQAEKLFIANSKSISKIKKTDVIICPPILYLEKLKRRSKKLGLGAQNIFYEESGAYTGEISADMLYDIGAHPRIPEFLDMVHDSGNLVRRLLRAEEIANLAPLAVQGLKEVANYSRDHGIQQGLEYVAQRNAAVVPNEDMIEAVSAFLEKRTPRFNGR